MTSPSPQFLADLERREGFRAEVYLDDEGNPTQGFGQHDGVKVGDPPVTREQAAATLAVRAGQALADAAKFFQFWVFISPVRQEAIADMFYNMGAARVAVFMPFLDAAKRGDWQNAAAHILINSSGAVTPYLLQTKSRAVEIALRLATGTIESGHEVLGGT